MRDGTYYVILRRIILLRPDENAIVTVFYLD